MTITNKLSSGYHLTTGFQVDSLSPVLRSLIGFVTDEPPSTTQLLDTDVTTRLYLDRNEAIRIRVERDEFYDNEPGPRKAEAGHEERVEDEVDRKAPYSITVSKLIPGSFSVLSDVGICEWRWIGRACVVGEYGTGCGNGGRVVLGLIYAFGHMHFACIYCF